MEMTGAQILVQSLLDQGVNLMFGYPGGTVLNIYDALYERRTELTHILTSHEQGAAHAADGYARSTGKTGVVLATSGPGATNLVTGIATAFLDSVPLVAITGNVPLDLIGRDSFQEVDTTGITNPIVKHNFFVQSAGEIAEIVREAFTIANSGRKGPVHIDIPKDITAQKAEYVPQPRFSPRPNPAVCEAALAEAVSALQGAQRPLIYAGGGVVFSGASAALVALSEKIGAPVCVSMMGISSVPADYPLYLGMVGMHGTPTANMATKECDVLLVAGARFSDRVAGNRASFARNARIIHIDIDQSEMNKNVRADIQLVGNAGDVLKALHDKLRQTKHEQWAHAVLHHKAHNPLPTGLGGLTPYKVVKALKDALNADAFIVTDVGQHQVFTAQHYPFTTPRTFLSSCGLGTMGYGLGAAVGAKLGNPGRQVALITGDGCFHMNMSELAVAVTHNIPITILIMNNRVLGMVHQWQTLFYGKRYSNTEICRATDYVKLAEAFGAKGFRIEREADLRQTLGWALSCGGPCVVDCSIDFAERVYPIIPPGGSASDMIFCD